MLVLGAGLVLMFMIVRVSMLVPVLRRLIRTVFVPGAG